MISHVWVFGSNPETGTLSRGAVEVGMSKSMLSVPGLGSELASMIACRNDTAPESAVLTVETTSLTMLTLNNKALATGFADCPGCAGNGEGAGRTRPGPGGAPRPSVGGGPTPRPIALAPCPEMRSDRRATAATLPRMPIGRTESILRLS